jgi:hypothetical protein
MLNERAVRALVGMAEERGASALVSFDMYSENQYKIIIRIEIIIDKEKSISGGATVYSASKIKKCDCCGSKVENMEADDITFDMVAQAMHNEIDCILQEANNE